MNEKDFIIHACEQVLRFTRVNEWDDLSKERKVQLGFNMGVVSLGLHLSKDDGFTSLANARKGVISIQALHEHLQSLVAANEVAVNEENAVKPF